jgi:hypothetical protein
MKLIKLLLPAAFIAGILFFACQKSVENSSDSQAAGARPQATKESLDPLTLSCTAISGASINVTVCAGNSGASAGFSLQWETLDDYNLYGWSSENAPSYRCASLSGVPGCASQYSLGSKQCVTVNVGSNLFDDCGASATCGPTDLQCGTTYIFRAFAHNVPGGLKASDKSGTTQCTTFACGSEGCTYTQGFWKTHGPVGCVTGNNTNRWWDAANNVAVTSLTLGNVSYTDLQLCSILNTPAGGNGLISLAHQLIAAKLNIANGSSDAAIKSSIDAADALIGNLAIPPIGSGSLLPSATAALVTALTNYNEGATGPGHCSNLILKYSAINILDKPR